MAPPKFEKYRVLPHITPPGTSSQVSDARAVFRALSEKTKPDLEFHKRFIKNRHQIAATHPFLGAKQRTAALQELRAIAPSASKPLVPPLPGGVGYGVYYSQPFLIAFSEGTALFWEIVCPSRPGGNVTDYLYITGMNRASLGVEALVKYNGQTQTSFIVYDWSLAAPARWQHEVDFRNMTSYLRQDAAHGTTYQVLPVMNMTYQTGDDAWVNQVSLLNSTNNCWNLVYQNTYSATADSQHGDFVGSWGPIVETFQNQYSGTNDMGALNTQLSTHLNGQWGVWSPLRQSDSQVRPDNKGFLPVFLDPNTSWVVSS